MVAVGRTARPWYAGGLPAGGSPGQVLAKSADSDYSLIWQSPPIPAPLMIINNRWFDNRACPAAANASVSVAIGTTIFVPIYTQSPIKIVSFGVYLTVAAGGTANFGVGPALANGQPGPAAATATANVGSASGISLLPAIDGGGYRLLAGWNYLAIGNDPASAAAFSIGGVVSGSNVWCLALNPTGPSQAAPNTFFRDTSLGYPRTVGTPSVTAVASTAVPVLAFQTTS